MRAWVAAFGVTSLTATLSLAEDAVERDLLDLPAAATHATFPEPDLAQVLLGQKLFYDPVLSGNRTVACVTCHHPSLGTSDDMSLSIGDGGIGLGPDRRLRDGETVPGRIPRNAPALWNLGASDITVMFHDGRVATDASAPFGFQMPPDRPLPGAVDSVLAAQAMLPILSPEEMAGQEGENPVADAVHNNDPFTAWALLAARVAAIPEYRERFTALQGERAIAMPDIANAIAAFIAYEFRAVNSPFDRYLAGDDTAMSQEAQKGMALFYGQAGCSGCHAGLLQTDQDFHAIGTPQIGPGKGGEVPYSDTGRHMVTGQLVDFYRFRTPSLRNITETAPYGHAGAFADLEAMLLHHMGPVDSLLTYDRTQARLHPLPLNDFAALDDEVELLDIAAAIELPGIDLEEAQMRAILAFLGALTDEASLEGRLGVPDSVPSGLPMDQP
ncbi:cytochrome-c peroxidase [Thalassobius sp. Cn5-15]|uniref:cytochrome-c peroxidase n=1 Tax=Thalassobius sp. Cn5-15 TaxID=2917763 RepID=UPI001EF3081C|nr:cytochrome c peroxidase [Thalassobius sp. Cn5-15]MCG7492105.1 cytochrome-c peroxidase [Thalassobius sp. Cn5-15]